MSPLAPSELAALLDRIGGFEPKPRIAVGVSGGPDSMALILLADRWARARDGEAYGLIVDHGLRPESAVEARTVAGWLGARRIPNAILTWAGNKPASSIQQTAREARYRLLAEWCRKEGVLHLLTAHHQADQVETYLIRRRAGSGVDGLAGMSAVRELRGCRLVRPLLAVPPERLRALLAVEKQPFLDDPSNLNPVFERARLRRLSAMSPTLWNAQIELQACATARIAREQQLDEALARSVSLHPAGFATVDAFQLVAMAPQLGERLLGRVAGCIGGAAYPARRERLALLRAELLTRPERGRTLGGCCFVPWRGRILVLREVAAASPPMPIEPGRQIEWDRRFIARLAAEAPPGFILDYLGRRVGWRDALRHQGRNFPALLYSVLPAWWDAGGVAAVPSLGYCRAGVTMLPSLSFEPLNPLAPGRFTVV